MLAMSMNGRSSLPDPSTAPELFAGVLQRRVMAYLLDVSILIAAVTLAGVVSVVLGFFTLGIPWLLLPVVIPAIILSYYAITLGSPMRATVGMSTFDIVLVPTRGYPLDGWKILIHPIVFWITVWVAWPISLVVALFTPRQQMVQDLVTGTIMLRRSPMTRHWSGA